jgi:hypothetical protein
VEPTDASTGPPAGPGRARRAAIAAAIVGYASVAALCRPLTGPALLAVLVAGVPLFWRGVARRPRDTPAVGPRSAVVWLGIGAAVGAFELGLRLGPNDLAHPTLSTLVDPALATYPGRVVGYLLWLGAGAWLVGR